MISVSELGYRYEKTPVIESWNLELPAGGLYGLLGLNGVGKTSFLKLLAGALIPTVGRIRVFGQEPSKRSAEHLSDVAFVPEASLPFSSSPRRWLKQYHPFRPAMDVAYWESLLKRFSIDLEQRLSELSFGQRKKFFIASALSCGARTILLDEPTNGLDIPSKAEVRRVLAEIADPERVVVIATHQVRDLEAVMDPYVVVAKGHAPLVFTNLQVSERLRTANVSSLAGLPVVFASPTGLGWSALIAEPSGPGDAIDLELLFLAVVHWMVFADQMHLPTYDRDGVFSSISFLLSNWQTPALSALINNWWFDVVFPAFFIVYGWAKLREVEARNALQS